MRVLPDESSPRQLKQELSGHQVHTVPEVGWAGENNGELRRLADERFDVLVTPDRGLPDQQGLTGLNLGMIIVRARSNDFADLLPLVPGLLRFLAVIGPGQVMRLVA